MAMALSYSWPKEISHVHLLFVTTEMSSEFGHCIHCTFKREIISVFTFKSSYSSFDI